MQGEQSSTFCVQCIDIGPEFVIDAMHEKVSNLLAGGFHVLFYHIEM